MDHEGQQVAEFLNGLGVTAFVLKYRLGPRYHHPAMLQDAQRAIRYVRGARRGIQAAPDRIGIMGFSAGGHLASTAATHFDSGRPGRRRARSSVMSSRPDFLILCYPVVTFDRTRGRTRARGTTCWAQSSTRSACELLSNEKQVTKDTPPTFLFHTDADTGVPAENSVMFYLALRRAGVPAELHIYEQGEHGLGLARTTPGTRRGRRAWPIG